MNSLSILVADDEESIRMLIRHWLTKEGHEVRLAGDGREAREAIQQRPFDLVITDVLMPEADGLDLIGELRRAQPTTRVLAISGGGRFMEGDDCLRMARGLGAHAVVMKPFNWQQLKVGMEQAFAPLPDRQW